MNFCITVRSAPQNSSHILALKICESLIRLGNTIDQVFFYEDGVLAASCFNLPDQDDIQITSRWKALSISANIPLYVCVAAALKRGVVDQAEAESNQLQSANLSDRFEITGLGQWVTTLGEDTKLLTFK